MIQIRKRTKNAKRERDGAFTNVRLSPNFTFDWRGLHFELEGIGNDVTDLYEIVITEEAFIRKVGEKFQEHQAYVAQNAEELRKQKQAAEEKEKERAKSAAERAFLAKMSEDPKFQAQMQAFLKEQGLA